MNFSVNHACFGSHTLLNSACDKCNCISNRSLPQNVSENLGPFSREPVPSEQSDLCKFYVCNSVKDWVCKRNPLILEERRNNNRHEISVVSGEQFQRVNNDVFHRYTKCIRSGGQHFQHLLCHWPVCIILSTGYHNCDSLRSYLHRLLPLPTYGIRRKADGTSVCRFSVKQEMVHSVFVLLKLLYFTVLKIQSLDIISKYWVTSMFIILLRIQL
jgi:hypothetical protein